MLASPDAPRKSTARDAGPLPSPQEGNIEVDPWSVPPPEGGYESLELDDDPAEAPQPAAHGGTPAPADAAPPDIASSIATRAEAEPETGGSAARARTRAIAAGIAVATLLVAAVSVWLLLRGGERAAPAAGPGVRVTVTQEAPWASPPPLAPIDPSYVERARPAPLPVRATAPIASPPPRTSAGSGASSRAAAVATAIPAAAAAPAASATPGPAETATEPPPEPAPAPPPAATVATAAIPLPPPPETPAPRAAPAAAASPRAPVLQTRSCVEDALRVPSALEGRLPPEVILHVQVGEDGRPADVTFPGAVDPRLRAALLSAVRTCRFTPGADASGRPAAARTTMRLRFEP